MSAFAFVYRVEGSSRSGPLTRYSLLLLIADEIHATRRPTWDSDMAHVLLGQAQLQRRATVSCDAVYVLLFFVRVYFGILLDL